MLFYAIRKIIMLKKIDINYEENFENVVNTSKEFYIRRNLKIIRISASEILAEKRVIHSSSTRRIFT